MVRKSKKSTLKKCIFFEGIKLYHIDKMTMIILASVSKRIKKNKKE